MQGTTQAVPVSGRALGSPLGFYRRPSYSLQCDAGESMIYRHLQQYYGILGADELLVPVLISPTRGKKVAPITTARDFIGHPRRRGVCCSCISCSIALHKSSADQRGCEDHSNPRHPVVHSTPFPPSRHSDGTGNSHRHQRASVGHAAPAYTLQGPKAGVSSSNDLRKEAMARQGPRTWFDM